MTNPAERREYLRAEVNVFVNEALDCEAMLARALDISEAGMRYAKPSGPVKRTGPEVRLEFCLPGEQEPVQTKGQVVYDYLDEKVHSTSVTFTALDTNDAERIRQYVIRRSRAELFDMLKKEHLGQVA